MSTAELIDRLCAVNVILTDIVRKQAAIIQQHGIEVVDGDVEAKIQKAEEENDILEYNMREGLK